MKHKYAEMIKAKVDNMELVVFIKASKDQWQQTSSLPTCDQFYYFLCLPQHKEACLHWLNGGEVEYTQDYKSQWFTFTGDSDREWSEESLWMRDEDIRIKPKKEKRWIGVNVTTGKTTSAYTHDDEGNYAEDEVRLTNGNLSDWQFIEIEVEV